MIIPRRHPDNPILMPAPEQAWESDGAFNGSVVRDGDVWHMVYRAMAPKQKIGAADISLSTVGYATSRDGVHFTDRRQLLAPYYSWEQFGCEDPRLVKIGDTFYITYTALSTYPFSAQGIHVGMAMTKDFRTIMGKHLVTTFNSKAMALFPEKIGGRFAAIITAHTDMPPAKIGIAYFDHEYDIWSTNVWDRWYATLDEHIVPLLRKPGDHIEVGTPPVATDRGWLLVYCYIHNYRADGDRVFGIEAVLLDRENPAAIVGRTTEPLLVPEKHYELYGNVPNVIFPTGAVVDGDSLAVYYGAGDTTCSRADVPLTPLLDSMTRTGTGAASATHGPMLVRSSENPVISPDPAHAWESKLAFNPGAVTLGDTVHILYRAMGNDDTSVMGYAASTDGATIAKRLPDPVYVPREPFEQKLAAGNSGCEDPRLTAIDGRVYMLYTAFDGRNPPRVAMTSIHQEDMKALRWAWEKPILISPPVTDDKDACVFPEKIRGKYVFLHRLRKQVWIDTADDLRFTDKRFLTGEIVFSPSVYGWDNEKIGIGPPPIRTPDGWLLIYHGISKDDLMYRLGAVLLDAEDPSVVVSRLPYPILSPETECEKKGLRPGTVFACGAAVMGKTLFVYYGGGDKTTCVAAMPLASLLAELAKERVSA